MKNNFITKIIGATLAFAMMIGAGIGASNNKKVEPVYATPSSNWVQCSDVSDFSAGDYIIIATNDGSKYFNGVTKSGPHWDAATLDSSDPASTSAAGVILLESTGASNKYYLQIVSSSEYVTATKAASKGSAVSASDAYGWTFAKNATNYFELTYGNSSAAAKFCSYNNADFRSYSSYASGQYVRIYKYNTKTLSSIAVKTASTKTIYYAGECFNPAGLVITATYSDSTTADIAYADHSSDFTFSPTTSTALNTDNNSVTITYGGKSTTQAITVNAPRTMTSIELHGAIVKTEYYVGDSWDLSGLDIQVNWSEGDPTFVDLDDASVDYECNPTTATSTSIDSFDIDVLYGDFYETFTVDGLTVTEHPLVDILDKTTIPSSAIGTATSSWGDWTEVTDYTYSASNTNGAKYQAKLMGPGSSSYVGRMNDSANGGFYTSKAPIGVRIKTIGFSAIAASKNVSVYLSNEIYESLPVTTDYKATLTSTNLSYTVEGNFSCFAIRGRGSSLDVGALTIEYEEINPSISASPDSITLSVNNSQDVEITVENYTSIPTLECVIQSGAASISSATVGSVNSTTYKATATITASNVSGNAVVRVRDTTNPNLYYVDIDVTVESVANVIENTITTSSSLAYHYSMNGAVVDQLDKDFTENEEKSYANWSEKTGTSGAVYAGNTYGGAENIQLKSNDSVSGIVTTSSAGFAKKITVVWNSGTASGRTLDVYGKNSAYEAATDLYDSSKKGTRIGSIVKGTSTSLTITSDYEFIGLRSNNGGMNIESIDIQWGDYSYTYSNISMRFGGSIDKDLWDELDTNENPIAGVGVLITGYEEQQRSPYSIKDHYDEAVQFNAVTNIKTQVGNCYVSLNDFNIPEKNNAYYWNLKYAIASIDDMLDSYTAAAYIKLTNGDLVFLKQVKYSVWSLAKDYLDNRGSNEETADGSLYNIVASAGLE